MIEVDETTDDALILQALSHPDIFDSMTDDRYPTMPENPVETMKSLPGIFLRAMKDGAFAGIWWLIWRGKALEAHTMLLPNCRGADAIEATKKAIRWVFDNTDAEAITSYAWSDSPAVNWFCRKVGLKRDRTEPWPATRNGHQVDITWFTLTRKEA